MNENENEDELENSQHLANVGSLVLFSEPPLDRFRSNDPKYPVENLLDPDSQRGPWLNCPRDKSGKLKVELQLERVVPISYIDVGNCGCAFLQIDVGRSSWPLDRPFITLLPATMLMSLADSKEGKNRSGVRMFKDDDFLTPASGESWDRLRLTCSQPFTRHQSFGLAFLRVRSSLDPLADSVVDLSAPGGSGPTQNSSDMLESDPRPWLTNPSIRRTFFPDPQTSTKEIAELKSKLKQLQPGPLGRAAHMVLSAANKAPLASAVSPKNSHGEPGPSHPKSADHCPTQVLSPIGGGQQEQGKDISDLRPKMTKVSRLLDSVPFVQTQPNWTEIVNKKLKFPPTLLGAIQEGQLGLVQQLLESGSDVSGAAGSGGPLRNVEESEDRSWREALNLAIRLGHEAITDVLLANIKFDFRQIHEALLVAVDTNQPAVVRRLLARLEREKGRKVDTKSFSLAFFDSSIDGSRFAPGVTPLTLACQKDLYEIAQLLMDQGHTIARPHPVSCACLECSNARRYDLLKFSLSRINTYRGIASRAHLSLASEDAMLAAFQLSRELRRLARKEPEFKPQYIALESICQDYGFELLGMCRNQSEVTAVLNDMGEDSETEPEAEGLGQAFEEGIPNLARLRLAVNYNQKQFVAHPICQQVLSSIWCGNLAGWRGSTTIWKLFIAFLIFLTMPFLCIGYWLVPKSRLGHLLKIPVLKFLLHSASYLWFLIFLLGESLVMETQLSTFKGRSQSVWETSLHMIWVTGFLWFECKEVWIEGLRSYLLDWWNFLDVVILSLYLASFALRLLLAGLAYMHCQEASDSTTCHYFTTADLGTRLTELTKTVSRLQSEVASVQKTLAAGGTPRPPDGASILSRYITRVRNSFQNLGPPTPETPAELTMPGIVETEVSLEAGLDAIREAETPASGEPSHSSPAHVLVHREQEAEGAGDLPLEEGLETKAES
ncbi:hypothetical protein STEG23_036695 [Scotinomys teguina]